MSEWSNPQRDPLAASAKRLLDQSVRDLYRSKGLLGNRLANLTLENPEIDLTNGGDHRVLAGLVDFE